MAYIDVAKLTHIRFMCHKVLPAVYDESLSYLEGLGKLTAKLNDTIDGLNKLDDNVDLLNDSVINLNDRVASVEGEISGFEEQIVEQFNALKNDVDVNVSSKLEEVDDRVDSLEQSVNTKLAEFEILVNETVTTLVSEVRALIGEQLAEINKWYEGFKVESRKYVEEEVRKALEKIPEITSVMVIDPTTGKLAPIQECVNNMFIYSSYNALTIDEYNSLNLTIDECNHIIIKSVPRGLTIMEWLHDAKNVLVKSLKADTIKPFSYPNSIVKGYLDGADRWLKDNVDINFNMWAISGCYSCSEIASLGYTIDEWNSFNVTISDYLLKGNTICVL